jgi:hypothetical protein
METVTPFDFLSNLFSKDGLSNGYISVKFYEQTKISFKIEEGSCKISFEEELPTVHFTDGFMMIQPKILGIKLEKDGGTFQIKSFPDIPFKYNWLIKDIKDS